MTDLDLYDRAACRGQPYEWFELQTDPDDSYLNELGAKTCITCPVRQACLQVGLSLPGGMGEMIWGGEFASNVIACKQCSKRMLDVNLEFCNHQCAQQHALGMGEKSCPHCQKTVPPGTADKVYCSRECQKAMRYVREKLQDRDSVPILTKACGNEFCNQTFDTQKPQRQYCSDRCRHAQKSRRNYDRRHTHHVGYTLVCRRDGCEEEFTIGRGSAGNQRKYCSKECYRIVGYVRERKARLEGRRNYHH